MIRFFALCALFIAMLQTNPAWAEPSDIDAAARGVVRVVIMGSDGEDVFPISHGTGFAVTPTRILTNAHVIREAAQNKQLRIGIVPAEGDEGSFARITAISPRNDLALVEITGGLRLPPLTLSGMGQHDNGEVSAVGYPMNVDRAQGLTIRDIFKAQPPVKSRGHISGKRPSRQFDTILHTAPIARGNSGGPLLDTCGRVLGVNSFGADSGGSDAEFFFAVSMREILPFLRAQNVQPRINELPCRSLSELNTQERERVEREQESARADMAVRAQENRAKRERAQLEAHMAVQEERENTMAIAFLLALVTAGTGAIAWQAWPGRPDSKNRLIACGIIGSLAAVGAAALWFTRPGLDAIDRKLADMLSAERAPQTGTDEPAINEAEMTCTLDLARSRITGAQAKSFPLAWDAAGCVNTRTQYGYTGGQWSRVLVPSEEAAVSVNIYDPHSRTFRTDRYLLGRAAMEKARRERGKYKAPQCGTQGAAAKLGDLQGAVTALLPQAPNERLVYSCAAKE